MTEVLELEVKRLQRAVNKLGESTLELERHIAAWDADPILWEAIVENRAVIAKYQEQIAALQKEIAQGMLCNGK